jgi:ATPase family associated with various cellular activities (AAA)
VALHNDTWWSALWITLFYLSGLEYAREGKADIRAQKCPPSAYLTSKCLDALESVLKITRTRRDRFSEIILLLSMIQKAELSENSVKAAVSELQCAEDDRFSETLLLANRHAIQDAATQLSDKLEEYEWISSIPDAVEAWKTGMGLLGGILAVEDGRSSAMLLELAKALLQHSKVFARIRDVVNFDTWNQTLARMAEIARNPSEPTPTPERAGLPAWIWDEEVVEATRDYEEDQPHGPLLQNYWYERSRAADRATQVIRSIRKYIAVIEATFEGIVRCAGGHLKAEELELESLTSPEPGRRVRLDDLKAKNLHPPGTVLKWLANVSNSLSRFDEELAKDFQWAVAYADRTLHEQLSFEQSHQYAKFDIAELAHALRIVTRFGERADFRLIKLALDTVCRWQHDDGTWPATRPFLSQPSGFTAHPHSIEIAWAVVSIMKTVADNPHRFGMSSQEIASQLASAYTALEKHFQWLNGASMRFRLPTGLETVWPPSRETECPSHAFGWCSDRTPQPSTIHTWVTANGIEFLGEYRDLLQQRVNDAIRHRFQSYHPGNLHKLVKVGPADLGRLYQDRVTTHVREIVQGHTRLDRLESTSYFHRAVDAVEPKAWSMILYGPPGTSKTYLAKGIAGELGWPLIALSPSDFLAGGEGGVERRAREIFEALKHGSRMVYFFDEIDELILDREVQKTQERSVFSFLTPSFLTKLQDLHDAAKERQFISIIATNYLERIDQAARRAGRVDRKSLILYPDLPARVAIIVEEVLKMANKDVKEASKTPKLKVSETIKAKLDRENLLLRWIGGSALLPFVRIKQGTEDLWHKAKETADGLEKAKASAPNPSFFGVGSEDYEVNFRSYVKRRGAESEFKQVWALVQPDAGDKHGVEVGAAYAGMVEGFEEAYRAHAEHERMETKEIERLFDLRQMLLEAVDAPIPSARNALSASDA